MLVYIQEWYLLRELSSAIKIDFCKAQKSTPLRKQRAQASLAAACLGQTFRAMFKLFDSPTLFLWQTFHMLLNSISLCFSLPINTVRVMMELVMGPCQESGWNNKLFYHTLKMYFTNLKKKLLCECIIRTSHFHSTCSHVQVLRQLSWRQDCRHPYHLLASPRKKNVGFARTTWEFTTSAFDLVWSFGFLVFHFSLFSFERWGRKKNWWLICFDLKRWRQNPKDSYTQCGTQHAFQWEQDHNEVTTCSLEWKILYFLCINRDIM